MSQEFEFWTTQLVCAASISIKAKFLIWLWYYSRYYSCFGSFKWKTTPISLILPQMEAQSNHLCLPFQTSPTPNRHKTLLATTCFYCPWTQPHVSLQLLDLTHYLPPPTKFNLFPMRTYSITLLICSLTTTCITWWPPQPLNPPTIVHQQAHYKYGQIVNPTLYSHGCCLCTTIIRRIATSFHDRYYLLALIDQCNQWWMQSVVDNGKTLNQEPKQGLGFITNWYNTMNKQYQAKKKLKKRKYHDIDLFS